MSTAVEVIAPGRVAPTILGKTICCPFLNDKIDQYTSLGSISRLKCGWSSVSTTAGPRSLQESKSRERSGDHIWGIVFIFYYCICQGIWVAFSNFRYLLTRVQNICDGHIAIFIPKLSRTARFAVGHKCSKHMHEWKKLDLNATARTGSHSKPSTTRQRALHAFLKLQIYLPFTLRITLNSVAPLTCQSNVQSRASLPPSDLHYAP